jgi:uncharacterized protein (TIGR00730 family)
MQDFTAGGIHALPSRSSSSCGDPAFDQRVKELVHDWGCDSPELIQQLMITALKMARDKINVPDLKLANRALNELRYAARTFAPYRHKRKVCVFGSARTSPDAAESKAAEEFTRKMREHDYMTITGGGDGIMGAAQRGAGRDFSFGLNIRLPFEQRANEIIHGDEKLINFNYFFTRKLNFVKESHAVVLFPGGFGTIDEGFEVLTLMQTGKARIFPLVLVDKPGGTYWRTLFSFITDYLLALGLVSREDFHLFHGATDVDDAVAHILQFYKNFRSYRWVGNRMVVRVTDRLTETSVKKLSEDFADVLATGEIVQSGALPEEANEPELADLPRLVFTPHRRNFGRIRCLLDGINLAETERSHELPTAGSKSNQTATPRP